MTDYDKKHKKTRSAGRSGGFNLPVYLFTLFLILQVAGVIDWKWLWLTSPIWIGVSIGLLFFIIVGFILLGAFIGFIGASSAAVIGIKSWFGMKEQEDVIDHKGSVEDPES